MYFILKKRTVIIAMTVLLFALCVPAVIGAFGSNEAVETVAENTNWGLGFKEDGKPPTGNASIADLAKHNAYYIGDTSKISSILPLMLASRTAIPKRFLTL